MAGLGVSSKRLSGGTECEATASETKETGGLPGLLSLTMGPAGQGHCVRAHAVIWVTPTTCGCLPGLTSTAHCPPRPGPQQEGDRASPSLPAPGTVRTALRHSMGLQLAGPSSQGSTAGRVRSESGKRGAAPLDKRTFSKAKGHHGCRCAALHGGWWHLCQPGPRAPPNAEGKATRPGLAAAPQSAPSLVRPMPTSEGQLRRGAKWQ